MPETRGRKVNKEFDIHLLSQLIYVSAAQAEGQPGTATMHVNANAMFSYAVIRAQAKGLQQEAAGSVGSRRGCAEEEVW